MDVKVFNPEDIKSFGGNGDYESRLLLDSYMAGEPCVNVNHGTIPGGGHTAIIDENGNMYGPAHEKAEVYLGLSGESTVYLEDKVVTMKNGTLIYIPAGTKHYIINNSKTEPATLVTIWPDEKDNITWHDRLKVWGKTYKRADED